MDDIELKQAIIEDMAFLKTAKIDIVDKKTYYRKLKKYGWKTFGKLYLPVLILGLIFIKWSVFNPSGFDEYLIDCVGFGLLIPALVSLFFLTKIMDWIIFEEQLLPRLKTKDIIEIYLKKSSNLYLKIYSAWLAVGMFLLNPIMAFAIELTAIIFVSFIVYSTMYSEVKRIGAGIFVDYLAIFFNKEIPSFQ